MAGPIILSAANPQFGATADFNRDGKLDLVLANYGSGSASVLLGNGDGTFGTLDRLRRLWRCSGSRSLGISTGTGSSTSPYHCSWVAILLGRGDGTFQPEVSYPEMGPYHGITADFNGDGNLDLAIADSGVSVLLGNGDGTFGPTVEYAAGGFSTMVAAGDFNRDGKLDLVTSNYSSNTVSILLGNGDGTFQPHVDYSTGNNPGGSQSRT